MRTRRGTVSIEYVMLASLLVATTLGAFVLPQLLQGQLEMAGDNMDLNRTGADDAPSSTPPVATSDDDDDVMDAAEGDGDWGGWPPGADDDASADDGGCNQGKGNGAEGCDPGNSNQGDPDRSNDEPGADGRGNGAAE